MSGTLSIRTIGEHLHDRPPASGLTRSERSRAESVIRRNPTVSSVQLIHGTNVDDARATPEDGGSIAQINGRLGNVAAVDRLRNRVQSRDFQRNRNDYSNIDNVVFASLPTLGSDEVVFWFCPFARQFIVSAINDYQHHEMGTTFCTDMSFNIARERNTISLSAFHTILRREVVLSVMFAPRRQNQRIYCRFFGILFDLVPEMLDVEQGTLRFPGFTVRPMYTLSFLNNISRSTSIKLNEPVSF